MAPHRSLTDFEEDLLRWLHDDATVARLISDLTELEPLAIVAVVVLVVLLALRRSTDAVFLAAGVGVVWALNPLLKQLVGRSRPDLWPLPPDVSEYSFPSGHATSSMIFYLALALALTAHTRWYRLAAAAAVVLSLLIGTSRVMLGVHWPSDVIGGWAFGMLWVLVTLRPAELLLQRRSTPAATPAPRE